MIMSKVFISIPDQMQLKYERGVLSLIKPRERGMESASENLYA